MPSSSSWRRKMLAVDDRFVVERHLRRTAKELLGSASNLRVPYAGGNGSPDPSADNEPPRTIHFPCLDTATVKSTPSHAQGLPDVAFLSVKETGVASTSGTAGLGGTSMEDSRRLVSFQLPGMMNLADHNLSTGVGTQPGQMRTCESDELRGSFVNASGNSVTNGTTGAVTSSSTALGSYTSVQSVRAVVVSTVLSSRSLLSYGSREQQLPPTIPGNSAELTVHAFLGRDLATNESVIIWIQRLNRAFPNVRGCIHVMGATLHLLKEGCEERYIPGIPRCLFFGVEKQRYQCLVTPALGPSLADLLAYCGGKLSERTVLQIALQLLELLRHCHSRQLMLNDLSLKNIRLGSSKIDSHILYLTSFAHAQSFESASQAVNKCSSMSNSSQAQQASNTIIRASAPTKGSWVASEGIIPTADFDALNASSRSWKSTTNTNGGGEASLSNALGGDAMLRNNNLFFGSAKFHLGLPLTPADDVESLVYMLCYCYLGSLPWQSMINVETGNFYVSTERGFGSGLDGESMSVLSCSTATKQSAAGSGGEGGPTVTLTRQLYRTKEQFLIHSHRSSLPDPIKLLIAAIQRFSLPIASYRTYSNSTSTVGEEDMKLAYTEIIAAFRHSIQNRYGAESFVFDWNLSAGFSRR